jgi:hypothetical protein
MNLDENDLLTTNIFIPKPELNTTLPDEEVDGFRDFYKKTLIKEQQDKIISDTSNINININDEPENEPVALFPKNNSMLRKQREVKTFINVDSRDRNKILYPKPNNFKIFMGRSFYNVKSIKLAQMEFPNTDAVINTNNRYIYWRNQEDIDLDCITVKNDISAYPIYSAALKIGSYTANSLQTEIIKQLNNSRRLQGTIQGTAEVGVYHYFVVSLNINTDIVSFTSLILKQLANNPFSVTINTGLITVTLNNHGYTDFEQIYITGSNTIAGINSSLINGFQTIRVISINTFTFQVIVNASSTVIGGGNTTKSGKIAPFQLLFGGHTTSSNTVAQNIGYPLEDSSQLIYTNIAAIETLYEMTITTLTPHLLQTSAIGSLLSIGFYDGILFTTYQNLTVQIYNVDSTTQISVQINDSTLPADLTNNILSSGWIQFGTNLPIQVSSYSNYNTSLFMVTTETAHNYSVSDIRSLITLYNTVNSNIINDSDYDGPYELLQIPSSTQMVFPGVLVDAKYSLGQIIRNNVLSTHTVMITSLTSFPSYTLITCSSPHKLKTGDTISLGDIELSPKPFTYTSFIVQSTPTNNTLIINYAISSFILSTTSYIGTGLITISFPGHGFNTIMDISQSTPLGPVTITTTVPHNLSIGNTVRIMQTNTSPSLDEGGYILTNATTYTFTFSPGITLTNIPTVITGIIGMSNTFNLYNCTDIGGITGLILNGITFNVRTVVDVNTFEFYIQNEYATSTTTGITSVYISSLLHGYLGTQTNTKTGFLNRSINLEGENYCLLTSPQLGTMENTGPVNNVFARISLDQAPGYVCFSFLSNPKEYNSVPLNKLDELEFSCVNYNGSLYNFNDLDFSYVLEIIEIIDETSAFNISSRRGIQDTF